MPYPQHLLPTTVVGSYPQPDWLIHRERLQHRVPRIRAPEIWRFEGEMLEQAQDDATLLAIRDMERAGIDIVSDGEARRESYSNRFALALEGIDADNPGEVVSRTGGKSVVPRVVGKIRRRGPVELRDARFLRANTERAAKITLPGPFTMSVQCKNEYYDDEEALATDFAIAVNEELRDLKAAGMDVVQLDEPWMQARPEQASRYGVRVLNRALDGIPGPVTVHLCFGYAQVVHEKPHGYSFLPQLADTTAQQISIESAQPKLDLGVLRELGGKTVLLGVLDLGRKDAETADEIADHARRALRYIDAERLVLAPDCGMKYLPRPLAFAKLKAMADGAAIVRHELAG
ncbi:MAG: 5-methyltetrahydropteroyltriglutamate--homocysteine methyltransferase [Acetobacteraceae bacterium]|nr:5-methyltetrahydropteroyltriglutamate--homocysteine methyltransferase [Acetobacteraceae bacterium]